MKIGAKLKELRTAKEWDRGYVAKMIGVAIQTYGHYENDRSEPAFDTLDKIAGLYNISIGELFDTKSNDEVISVPLKNDLLRNVVKTLINQGVIEDGKSFNELDEFTQNIILATVDKVIFSVSNSDESSH